MKNILFVVDENRMGGVSTLLEDILNMLKMPNTSIDVLILHNSGDRLKNLPESVNVIYGSNYFNTVDLSIKDVIKSKSIRLLIKKSILVFDMKSGLIKYKIRRERKKILNKKYDVEIAFKDGFTALFTAFGNSKKKIHWLHYEYKLVNPNGKYDRLFKKILPTFNSIIAVSEGVMVDFNNIYHLEEKTSVIPNLINIEKIIKRSSEKVEKRSKKLEIITVGRLHRMKGYDRFIDAIYELKKEGYTNNVIFKIYGDGPEKEKLSKQVLSLNLENDIKFMGKVDNPYIYMKSADLFVLSSVYEPFGLVIIESLTLGTPVLATENAATNKLIKNNYDGIIVKNSTEGLYTGLKMILADREKLFQLKNNAKKFDYFGENEKIINQLNKLLK